MRILSLHSVVGIVLLGISLVVGSFLLANPSFFLSASVIEAVAESDFKSVEVGVAELSPRGEVGGYAIPASGTSYVACGFTLSDNPITSGQTTTLVAGVAYVPNSTNRSFTVSEAGASVVSLGSGAADRTVPVGANPNSQSQYIYTGTVTQTSSYTYYDQNSKQNETVSTTYTNTCSKTLTVNDPNIVNLKPNLLILDSGELKVGSPMVFRGRHINEGPELVVGEYDSQFWFKYEGASNAEFMLHQPSPPQNGLAVGGLVNHYTSANTLDTAVADRPGNVDISYCVDSGEDIVETSEGLGRTFGSPGENCLTERFMIAPSDVDLEPVSVVLETGQLAVGETVSFRGRYRNNGTDNVGFIPSRNKFFWRYVGEPTQSLNEIDRTSGPNAGQTITQFTDTLVITEDKNFQIGYRLDMGNTVAESNETNNLKWFTFVLNPEVDLAPTDIILQSGALERGQTVRFRGVHTNNGPDDLAQSFTNRFYWRYLGEGATGWRRIGDSLFTLPLTDGALGYSLSDYFQIPTDDTRDIQVGYRVDILGDVTETNENNNLRVQTFEISAASGNSPIVDLKVDGSDGPVTGVVSGTEVNLTWDTTAGSAPDGCIAYRFTRPSGMDLNGNTDVTIRSDVTFTIVCDNSQGSDSDSVSVSIAASSTGNTPTITARPEIIRKGQSTTIEWDANGAENCVLSGPQMSVQDGNVAGNHSVSLQNTAIFAISCDDGAADNVQVIVLPEIQET